MNKIIWQTEDNRIYLGFTVLNYAVPVHEFKTFSEFIEYVRGYQAELIMYYDFLENIMAHGMPKHSKVEQYINSLEKIDII